MQNPISEVGEWGDMEYFEEFGKGKTMIKIYCKKQIFSITRIQVNAQDI